MDPFLPRLPREPAFPPDSPCGASFFDYIIFQAAEKCKIKLKYLIIIFAPLLCRGAKSEE